MARELSIKINAEDVQAKRAFAETEKAIDRVTAASEKTDDAIKKAGDSFTKTGADGTKALAAITAAFAAANLGERMNKAVAVASQIADVSQKIGIGVEAVQRFGFAAKQSGSSIDAVGTAITMMSRNIVEGSKDTDETLRSLGLNVENLRKQKPEDAFIAITEAIKAVPDPMRQSAVALEIFGRGGAQILPAIKAGFKDVGDQAPRMSAALVESGDHIGDKWDEMQTRFDNLQAMALLPFASFFVEKIPESVQVGMAGVASFMPSLTELSVAIIALGGPSGAMVALKGAAVAMGGGLTALGGTVMGFLTAAGAALLTFFTTTLPAAFTATIAFLGPVGLIALAVVALAAIWFKWGDDIKRIVGQVYTAIKEWLMDKLGAVFDWVGKKVQAVTGFFKDMYEKVVGHSFVPDMVRGIQREFGKLDAVMVNPVKVATDTIDGLFQSMVDRVSGYIDKLIGKIPGIGQALGGVGGSGFGGGGSGSGGFGSNLMSGLGSGLAGIATNLIGAGIGAIGNKLKGGEEGMYVNPARDAFFQQFRSRYGGDPYSAIDQAFQQAGVAPDVRDRSVQVLLGADTMQAFQYAVANIQALLGEFRAPGFAMGTRGRYLDFGLGTPVMLHGKERVMTEREGQSEWAAMADKMDAQTRELSSLRRNLPRQMSRAFGDEIRKLRLRTA